MGTVETAMKVVVVSSGWCREGDSTVGEEIKCGGEAEARVCYKR